MRVIYILAGANGSGKSTIASVLLPTKSIVYGGDMSETAAEMMRIVSKAVHIAQEENRKAGIANVYSINGKMVWQLPDGTIVNNRPY